MLRGWGEEVVGRSQAPLTWGVEHDEDRGVLLQKLVKVFIGQVINGAALICPGSLGDLGLWRLRTGRPKNRQSSEHALGPEQPVQNPAPGAEAHPGSARLAAGLTRNPPGGGAEG